MIFNSSTKVKDIDEITQTFKANNENRVIFYNQSCQKLQKKYGQKAMEAFQQTFTPQFDEQKWKTWLASFWITNTTNRNESIYWLANNATMNETILEKFKTENWLKDNGNQELKDYINNKKNNNQAIDVDDLNNHINDWFKINEKATHTERVEDINNKKILFNKIEKLPINSEKKEKLNIAIQEFYDQKTIALKPNPNDISFSIENELLIFKTHGWEYTKIDLNKNEIIGFWKWWKWITFTNMLDLLNTADLANKVLSEYQNKIPKDIPPFEYSIARKWIYFNDANNVWQDIIKRNYSWRDDRVISTWRWWDTSKIDTLYDNPWEFAKYLSDRWIEGHKRVLNISSYPIINWLSDLWLTFLDIEEAKKSETRLKKVKEMQKQCDPWTTPFSIDWKKLVFSTSYKKNTKKIYFPDEFPDNFSWKTQDLSSFPTILKNKTIFLRYMNDRNNNMR